MTDEPFSVPLMRTKLQRHHMRTGRPFAPSGSSLHEHSPDSAGDFDRAARFVEEHRHEVMNRELPQRFQEEENTSVASTTIEIVGFPPLQGLLRNG